MTPALITDFVIVIGGALLILGIAEIVIRLTLRLARHYGLSGSFVGLTILSVGTSLFEITTHVVGSVRILREPASMNALSGLLLGSNIGSDIFQQNFVLPMVGLIGAVAIARRNLLKEIGALIAASALLWLACLGGAVTRLEGASLVGAYIAYLVYLGRRQSADAPVTRERLPPSRTPMVIGLIVLCFAGMAAIADPYWAPPSGSWRICR